jgi:uncharacterized protein DUF3570
VQLTRTASAVAIALGLLAAGAARATEPPSPFDEVVTGSLLRYFTDSQHIRVRSLMGNGTVPFKNASLELHVNNEQVRIPAVSAPVGSAEAVDAITTASRPISGNAFEDFVKVRNEFQGALTRGHAALDYYLSTESDYLGQQLGARLDRDYMNDQLNVSMGSSFGWDAIKPLADDDTNTGRSHKSTLHWNAVATEVMSSTTMMRFGLELNLVNGLQHNPYRHVYAGGTNVAERHPDTRQRRDAFFKLNHWLSNRSSVKLGYRLYSDDWGIVSHETDTKLSQYITRGVYAQYQYRWYTQTAADFFRKEYLTTSGIDGYLTGDYRMGPLSSHLFGFAMNADLGTLLTDHPMFERLGLWLSIERYFNSNNYSANILETGLDFRF